MKIPVAASLGLAVFVTTGVAAAQWQPAAQPAPVQPGTQQPSQGQYPGQGSPNTAPAQYPPAQYPAQYSAQGDAESTLQRADREDTGRGLQWVWLDGSIGFQAASLQGFKSSKLLDGVIVDDSASGLTYGGAVGVRMIALTLGARFRYGNFSAWDMWSLGLEGGFHIPLGHLEPYVTLGAGYVSVGALKQKVITSNVKGSDVDIDGYGIRIGGGLDYYITPRFSVGAALSGDFLGLYRAQVKGITTPTAGASAAAQADATYGSKGSSLGFALTACATVGLHF